MRKIVYAGSFDPITKGHLDLVRRASLLFDQVVVAVATSHSKKALFTVVERVEMVRLAIADIPRTEAIECSGLTSQFAVDIGACAMLRGLRGMMDFDFERQLADMNTQMKPELQTVFMAAAPEYVGLSASLLKEIISMNGDVRRFLPKQVAEKIRQKFADRR